MDLQRGSIDAFVGGGYEGLPGGLQGLWRWHRDYIPTAAYLRAAYIRDVQRRAPELKAELSSIGMKVGKIDGTYKLPKKLRMGGGAKVQVCVDCLIDDVLHVKAVHVVRVYVCRSTL